MIGPTNYNHEDTQVRQNTAGQERYTEYDQGSKVSLGRILRDAGPVLFSSGIDGRGNNYARADAMQSMQQTHGNRAVQRFIQRSKDTSMPAVQREMDNDSWWDEITKSLYQDDEGTYQMPQDDIKGAPPAPEPKPWDPSQGPPPGFTPYDPHEPVPMPEPPPGGWPKAPEGWPVEVIEY